MKLLSNCKTQLASSQRLFPIFLFLLNQYWTVYIKLLKTTQHATVNFSCSSKRNLRLYDYPPPQKKIFTLFGVKRSLLF